MIIDDYGRCSAQACVKHHVYDWDFRFPIPNETVKQMDARFRDIGFVLAGGSLTFLDFETFLPKLLSPFIREQLDFIIEPGHIISMSTIN